MNNMTAPIIQANYERLEQVAARFAHAAATQERLIRTVRRQADMLIGGSWEGRGAEAFARELDDEVLPAMKRLADALREAPQVTGRIAAVVRSAEEAAARHFLSDARSGIVGPVAPSGEGGAEPVPSSAAWVKLDPSRVFAPSRMQDAIGLRFQGDDNPALNQAMEELLRVSLSDPARVGPLLNQIADLRGVDRMTIHAHYQTYLQLLENGERIGGNLPDINLDLHGDFLGSPVSLRFGKVVGDVFGLDPVFGALLQPTGGLVGPGDIAYSPALGDPFGYHGVFHDAGGYLYNYHNIGPGYDYLQGSALPTGTPLAGHIAGISWWTTQAFRFFPDELLFLVDVASDAVWETGRDFLRDMDDAFAGSKNSSLLTLFS
ncbi:MAG: WXG100 family type VII secretion target [Caldilineaceae bacterium]|nr:WXG100 family type VII secretion target [Caldilineaceae bacterium]